MTQPESEIIRFTRAAGIVQFSLKNLTRVEHSEVYNRILIVAADRYIVNGEHKFKTKTAALQWCLNKAKELGGDEVAPGNPQPTNVINTYEENNSI